MRLDKFLTNHTQLSRSESVKAIKQGRIKIQGVSKISPDIKIDENSTEVFLDGNKIEYQKFIYLMLNKPQGVVSATDDKKQKTVLDLLPQEYKKYNLFPCGRLDKDTVGLVILTNDGSGAHKVLSPKHHVEKVYYYECAEILSQENIKQIEQGVLLKDGYLTKPCKIHVLSNNSGNITLTEGKYHEIKRIFGALSNRITFLKRIKFGNIQLDENLKEGEFRSLTDLEKQIFE